MRILIEENEVLHVDRGRDFQVFESSYGTGKLKLKFLNLCDLNL
jgi:hypothetical protein